MSTEAEKLAHMKGILSTEEGERKVLNTSREFLDYITSDCAGLSPGVGEFAARQRGLTILADRAKDPEKAEKLRECADVYGKMVTHAPGQMYPRGSQIFDDLDKIEQLNDWMLDNLTDED